MRWALLLLGLSGCIGATTLNGARTLEPGQVTLQAGVANNVYSGQLRAGLAPDVDLGVHLRNGALGTDVRYRFVRTGRFHLATAPEVAVLIGPISGKTEYGFFAAGGLSTSLPLLAELELGRTLSVALAPRVTLSNRFVFNNKDGSFYQENAQWTSVILSAGTRVDWHPGRWGFGISFDVQHAPMAAVNPQPFVGADVRLMLPQLSRRARREVRQQAREARR